MSDEKKFSLHAYYYYTHWSSERKRCFVFVYYYFYTLSRNNIPPAHSPTDRSAKKPLARSVCRLCAVCQWHTRTARPTVIPSPQQATATPKACGIVVSLYGRDVPTISRLRRGVSRPVCIVVGGRGEKENKIKGLNYFFS